MIQESAEDFIRQQTDTPDGAIISVKANELDRRLEYSGCDAPLAFSTPANVNTNRYVTVKVSCPQTSPWQVYVPVQVRVQYPVVVASLTLNRGMLVDSSQLTIELKDAHILRGNHFNDINAVIGNRIIRRVSAGQPLRRNNVCTVCAGDRVTIYAKTGGLEIKTSGEAKSNGAIGDTIRVVNNRSERIIDAIVTGIGSVEVRM